jgi:tetratricopeptide (TPR) repeat protein
VINLRNCVRSAATIVSSASTTLGMDHPDRSSVGHGSEFGDCFPSEPSEPMLRWISSDSVYKIEEKNGPTIQQQVKNQALRKQNAEQVDHHDHGGSHSDSDSDLETEVINALLQRGKEKFAEQDYPSAERLFYNCFSRTSGSGSLSLTRTASTLDIVNLLLDTYRKMEKWDDAQTLLVNQMASESQRRAADNPKHVLSLAEILMYKKEYAEARLYARRAFKGYRKLGATGTNGVQTSLRLLMRICHADGDLDDEDAYATILSNFTQQNSLTEQLSESTSPTLSPPIPPGTNGSGAFHDLEHIKQQLHNDPETLETSDFSLPLTDITDAVEGEHVPTSETQIQLKEKKTTSLPVIRSSALSKNLPSLLDVGLASSSHVPDRTTSYMQANATQLHIGSAAEKPAASLENNVATSSFIFYNVSIAPGYRDVLD